MTARDAEKLAEEIVADLAELRATLAKQFSELRENLERDFAMLKFAFQTRDPNQPLQ
jgi:molybdopterin converting factor small subunit